MIVGRHTLSCPCINDHECSLVRVKLVQAVLRTWTCTLISVNVASDFQMTLNTERYQIFRFCQQITLKWLTETVALHFL